jgi:hypothetical protein
MPTEPYSGQNPATIPHQLCFHGIIPIRNGEAARPERHGSLADPSLFSKYAKEQFE